jgi:hypothetical protein
MILCGYGGKRKRCEKHLWEGLVPGVSLLAGILESGKGDGYAFFIVDAPFLLLPPRGKSLPPPRNGFYRLNNAIY